MKEKKEQKNVIPDLDFYTIEQAALKMDVEVITLQRAIDSKELKAFVKNRNKFIFHVDLCNYIKSGGDALENKAKSNLPKK